MKSEKLLNAIGNMNEELIYGAIEEPTCLKKKILMKKLSQKWQYLAAAACLCILLVVPVAAANKELLIEVFENFTGWTAKTSGRIAIKELSPELAELEKGYYKMDSIEEAGEFIGIALPENALLKKAKKVYAQLKLANGEKITEHCIVNIIKNENGELWAIGVDAHYRYQNLLIDVGYSLVTELNPYENGGGRGVISLDKTQNQPKQTEHITSFGKECTIFYYTENMNDENAAVIGYSYMPMDDMLVSLKIVGYSEEKVKRLMIRLLDGFVLE